MLIAKESNMDNEMIDWTAHVLRRVVFRQDGGLTIVGKVLGIVTLLFVFAACSALSGCVNVAYTRNPLSDSRIQKTYQSTGIALSASYVIAFPQIMSPTGEDGLMLANIVSIPLGCVGLVDTACEAVIDTVCLPVDWPLAASRKRKWEEWQQEQAEGISGCEDVSTKSNGVWKYKAPDGVNEVTRYPDGTESVTLAYVVTPPPPLPKDAVLITSGCTSVTNVTVEPENWNCSPKNFVK